MFRLLAPAFLIISGCATAPMVRLHVDPAGLARLAPAVIQPIVDKAQAQQAELDRELQRAQERVAKAELAVTQTRDEPKAADTASIHEAKLERSTADLRWQRALFDVARWRGLVAAAESERAKAELMSHAGQEVDLEAFGEQYARMRAGMNDATRRAAADRTRLDEAERHLNAAKEKYAQAHSVAHR